MPLFQRTPKNRPDFTVNDLPKTRPQLFFAMLKSNILELLILNALYAVTNLPAIIWSGINLLSVLPLIQQNSGLTEELYQLLNTWALGMIPCLILQGPCKCGLKYVTRNYARDEHTSGWSDFWAAAKMNWKQGMLLGFINGIILLAVIFGVQFYQVAQTNAYLNTFLMWGLIAVAALWYMMNIFLWPLMITYELSFPEICKNALYFTIGRLPLTILFAILTVIPTSLAVIWPWALLYYAIIGFSITSMINVSYSTYIFDRYLNPQIEGAAINQGLAPREADPFLDEKLDGDVSEEELEDKVNQYRELYRKQREEQTAARQEKKHD